MKRILQDVPYLTQIDNKRSPFVACFNTSIGMGVSFCLLKQGIDKTEIGCGTGEQIEDFIDTIIADATTKQWMIKNTGRLGSWIWQYQRRTVYAVEAYVFNRIMNDLGFQGSHKVVTYDEICDYIDTGYPVIIGGNFKKVSKVGGHVICVKGYNSDDRTLIVNDPFGNAFSRYTDRNGEDMIYPLDFFRDGVDINAVVIEEC